MITRISSPSVSTKNYAVNTSPAFGMAKLNSLGRTTADEFGYNNNTFINGDLYKKQGLFSKSALSKELEGGASFATICTDYGCTKNGKANAEFIKNQILSGKSNDALKRVDSTEKSTGMIALFEANYDNPELSTKETDTLLGLIKDSIADTDFVRYSGIMKVGTYW